MYAYARAGNYVHFDVCEYYIYTVTGNRAWQTLEHLYYPQYSFVDVTELG